MTASLALEWMRDMLWTATLAGAPVILTVAVVGLAIAVLQAATQINDAAFPFAAKAFGVLVALTVAGAWMLTQLTDFARAALAAMGSLGG
ncbi:MAG: flagellar biosynthetic protein FliQ [Sandaracinaceae bacterium]